jgi:4a-hydroxytetrahydrobiopterin dehydratase
MKKRRLLSETELKQQLKKIPGWRVVKGKLHREFKFDSFVKAFGFMTSVAIEAETMNHHPDWYNVYNVVRVDLMTHDLGGIGTFDVVLAEKMNRLYRKS